MLALICVFHATCSICAGHVSNHYIRRTSTTIISGLLTAPHHLFLLRFVRAGTGDGRGNSRDGVSTAQQTQANAGLYLDPNLAFNVVRPCLASHMPRKDPTDGLSLTH